jgi:hypothetical protein
MASRYIKIDTSINLPQEAVNYSGEIDHLLPGSVIDGMSIDIDGEAAILWYDSNATKHRPVPSPPNLIASGLAGKGGGDFAEDPKAREYIAGDTVVEVPEGSDFDKVMQSISDSRLIAWLLCHEERVIEAMSHAGAANVAQKRGTQWGDLISHNGRSAQAAEGDELVRESIAINAQRSNALALSGLGPLGDLLTVIAKQEAN